MRDSRCWIAQGLPGVGEGLGVHVLVKHGVLHQVITPCVGPVLLQMSDNPGLHRLHVIEGVVQIGQRQVPTVVMRNADRVVQLVHTRKYGLLSQVLAQHPVLVEIGGMADFPAQRIHDGQARPHHLLRIQPLDETQRALPRIPDLVNQLLRHRTRTLRNYGLMFAGMAGKVT